MRLPVVLLLVLAFIPTGTASAQAGPAVGSGSERGLSFGLRAGLAIPTASLNEFTGVKAGAGVVAGIDLGYRLGHRWSFGGTVEFQASKMPEISGVGTGGGRFSGAAIRVVTPMVFARRELGASGRAAPYALLGLGANINAMDPDDVDGSYSVDGSLAVKAAVGLGTSLSPRTSAFVELAYRTDFAGTDRWDRGYWDQRYDFDMTSILVTVGLRR